MGVKYINSSILTNLGNSVREKFNKSGKMYLSTMEEYIRNCDVDFNTTDFNGGVLLLSDKTDDPTDMSNAFNGMTTLKGVPFMGDGVINATSAYRNCWNLSGEIVSGNGVKNVSHIYDGCKNLTADNAHLFIKPSMENMAYAFANFGSKLNWMWIRRGYNIKDMAYSYYNADTNRYTWTSTSLPLNCSNYYATFMQTRNLDDYPSPPTSDVFMTNGVATEPYIYSDPPPEMKVIDGHRVEINRASGPVDCSYMFCNSTLRPEATSHWVGYYSMGFYYGSPVTNMTHTFENCMGEYPMYGDKVYDLSYAFYNANIRENSEGGGTNFNSLCSNDENCIAVNMEYAFYNTNIRECRVPYNMYNMAYAYYNTNTWCGIIRPNVFDASYAFANCRNLKQYYQCASSSERHTIYLDYAFSNCPNFDMGMVFLPKNISSAKGIFHNSSFRRTYPMSRISNSYIVFQNNTMLSSGSFYGGNHSLFFPIETMGIREDCKLGKRVDINITWPSGTPSPTDIQQIVMSELRSNITKYVNFEYVNDAFRTDKQGYLGLCFRNGIINQSSAMISTQSGVLSTFNNYLFCSNSSNVWISGLGFETIPDTSNYQFIYHSNDSKDTSSGDYCYFKEKYKVNNITFTLRRLNAVYRVSDVDKAWSFTGALTSTETYTVQIPTNICILYEEPLPY